MANDATLSPARPPETHAGRPRWPALAAWWARAEAPEAPELGYESAHPWTLDVEAPSDGRTAPY